MNVIEYGYYTLWNQRKDPIRREQRLLELVYTLIELVSRQELRNTAKVLIKNYLIESIQVTHAAKAREAVMRYTGEDLPDLDQVREKYGNLGLEGLNEIDHLLLKIEFEGHRLDEKAGIDL